MFSTCLKHWLLSIQVVRGFQAKDHSCGEDYCPSEGEKCEERLWARHRDAGARHRAAGARHRAVGARHRAAGARKLALKQMNAAPTTECKSTDRRRCTYSQEN